MQNREHQDPILYSWLKKCCHGCTRNTTRERKTHMDPVEIGDELELPWRSGHGSAISRLE